MLPPLVSFFQCCTTGLVVCGEQNTGEGDEGGGRGGGLFIHGTKKFTSK